MGQQTRDIKNAFKYGNGYKEEQMSPKDKFGVRCTVCGWTGEDGRKKCPICDRATLPIHTHQDMRDIKKLLKKLLSIGITKALEFEPGKKYLVVIGSEKFHPGLDQIESLSYLLKSKGVDAIVTNIPVKVIKIRE